MSNKLLSGALVVLAALAVAPGETLYNGIRLPFEWPPKRVLTRKPMSVPYLDERPQVIPIDIGSQDRIVRVILHFVKAPLERRGLDQEVIYEKLPADMPWERSAMTLSDGVWYDARPALQDLVQLRPGDLLRHAGSGCTACAAATSARKRFPISTAARDAFGTTSRPENLLAAGKRVRS